MSAMRWARVIPWITALALGCGGDDKKPEPSDDAGPTTGDVTAPDFAGASAAEVLGERKVRVSWDPASDDQTAPGGIAYRVYRATEEGEQDFDGARRCGDPVPATSAEGGTTVNPALLPCYISAPAGARAVAFTDLVAGVEFHFVARAIDAAGNEDDNTAEVLAETIDESSPIFGGVRKVEAAGATSLIVQWTDGYDEPVPASSLVYDVYVKAGERPDPAVDQPAYTSEAGETVAQIDGLDPLTTYYVIVRARDPDGNTGGNNRVIGVKTPEGIGPTFEGAKRASPRGNAIKLFWTPGSDNVTIVDNIVYDIYQSLQSRRQDLEGPPTYVSEPGAASFLAENLEPGTEYFFVVRARDVAGNRDTNTKEVKTRTDVVDSAPPTFNGAVSVTGTSPTSVKVTWGAAADESPVEFDVFFGTNSTVATDTPRAHTKLGEWTFTGLTPDTTYFAIVRATDAAGNGEQNTKVVSGKTLVTPPPPGDGGSADTEPPTSGGPPTPAANPNQARTLIVGYPAATDNAYPAGQLRYHVCAEEIQSDCLGSKFNDHVRATSPAGATSVTVLGLTPRTPYWVVVRAEDPAGNLEANEDAVQQATATSWSENVRPILFDKCISCHSGADRVFIGQDNVVVRDTVSYDQPNQIVNVGSSFLEDQACAVVDPLNGCPLKLIDPGRPEFSLIYRKINPIDLRTPPFSDTVPNRYGGLREPRDATAEFNAEEDLILREWILQGAQAD